MTRKSAKELVLEILTSEKRSGTNHCKDARRDSADPLPNKAAEESAGVEGRDNDSRGNFATECHRCEDKLNKGAVH